MKSILYKNLSKSDKVYNKKINTISEEDRSFLDNANTTGLIQFGLTHMPYPKLWRDEKFELPFEYFETKKYENIVFETISDTLPYYDEGTRVRISDALPNIHLDKILPALNFGGASWQHFVQDILPIIIFNRDLLLENPDIDILLYDGHCLDKSIVNFFFEKLGIKNNVIYIWYKSHNVIKANELYNFECNTEIPTGFWPLFFYKEMNELLLKNQSSENKNVIYNRRNFCRKILNEEEVILCLKEYAESKKLNLIVFEAEKYSIESRFEIFKNAHTIFAPHGGANYNIIFSNPGIKFIECVFINGMYTLYNLAAGIGLNYYVMPDYGDNATYGTVVDIQKLKLILNK